MKKILMCFTGFLILVAGIALVLKWWPDVLALFKGGIGMFLAVAGLFMMYLVKDQK